MQGQLSHIVCYYLEMHQKLLERTQQLTLRANLPKLILKTYLLF